MENLVGIGIVIAIAGFVVYKMFWGKDEVSAPAPVKAPAPAPAEAKAKVPSKAQLSKMTKKELDDFAKVEFGVKLDARLKKDDMIKAFQKEVK
tara:strand:- start:567 stop:845 length:279 start_codon:yes stop_codon:yes gene_type:complete